MALGVIKDGPYGKYYAYRKDGVSQNLSLKGKGSSLTEEQLDELIEKGKVYFEADGSIIEATLIEYYNNYTKSMTRKIKYKDTGESASAPDPKDLEVLSSDEVKQQIIFFFSDNTQYYAMKKTASYLKTLKLSKNYFCKAQATEVYGHNSYITAVLILYGETVVLTMYLKSSILSSYKNSYVEISKSEYLKELEEYKEKDRKYNEEREAKQKAYQDCLEQARKWLYDLSTVIWSSSSSLTKAEMVKALESIVAEIPQSDLNTTLTSAKLSEMKKIFSDIQTYTRNNIYSYAQDYDEELNKMKQQVLQILRFNYDYYRVHNVRTSILQAVTTYGIEVVVDDIPAEQALDLGRFKTLKQVLVKGVRDAIDFICMHMYLDIVEPAVLEKSILYMLKTYHEFFNFPEKDIKAIAKFIAANNLKEYYDKISEYDEVIEVLLQEGSPHLRKKIMSEIAGTSRLNRLHLDKTFFIEKKCKVRENIVVNDPLMLLEQLRALIPTYNTGSDVAILTNIILSADGTEFTYQFYTFSESASGDDMDGRRVQYMTRLYNRTHTPPIYFDYIN